MTYQAVNEIFETLDADFGAAEAHGIAVGMLCVEPRADVDNWLQALFSDVPSIEEEDLSLLNSLFEQTRQLLGEDNDDYEFDLFLPDIEEPLFEQIEALRVWCQGFLYGVGFSQSNSDWPGEMGEVMRDIIELTKIDSDADDEEDANALMEVHEYLRVAILTVRDYFLDASQTQSH